ncbi:hypothetical protein EBZ80_17695, partial [bacterium]|nr:hypothetical protein [bacterium]
FDLEMRDFHLHAAETVLATHGMKLPPPRTAIETGRIIITQSQSLRVSTIDSIFHEWVSKFPAETGLGGTDGAPLALTGDLEHQLMRESAWEKAKLRFLSRTNGSLADPDTSDGDDPNTSDEPAPAKAKGDSPSSTTELARKLEAFSGFIWHLEQNGAAADLTSAGDLPPWLFAPAAEDPAVMLRELLVDRADAWRDLAGCLKAQRREVLISLMAHAPGADDHGKTLAELIENSFVTKGLTLNRRTFSDKATASATQARMAIEACLRDLADARKLALLRDRGAAAARLFNMYRDIMRQMKSDAGVLTFDDLLAGTSRIFNDPYAAGARYLLQRRIRHLMLDEFQDTSWPQWRVFNEVALEVLSATDTTIPGTVFLVGDEKQSIYGFRNSDPEVMDAAARSLADHGVLESPLNDSFRTCETVLEFVNRACGSMPGFPRHTPALVDGSPVNPDVGSITILPVAENTSDSGEELTADDLALIEASSLASWLRAALDKKQDDKRESSAHKIYDKAAGTWRGLEPRDCAILFRAADRIDMVEKALQKQQIPTIREESAKIFEQQEIRDCLELLRYLARPGDLNALLAVLKSPFVGLGDEFLAEALAATAEGRRHSPLRAGVALEKLLLGPHANDLAWIPDALARSGSERPSVLLETCLMRSHYAARAGLCRTAVESEVLRANLSAFIDLVRVLEADSDDNIHAVGSMARLMARMKDLKSPVGDPVHDVNAVRLMTVHKSKGLEFPLVAIVDTATPWVKDPQGWLKWTGESDHGIAGGMVYLGSSSTRPDHHAATESFVDAALAAEVAEANRVWYVALTRARQHLVITGTRRKVNQSLSERLSRLRAAGQAPLLDHGQCVDALASMSGVQTRPLEVAVFSPLQSGEITGSATPVLQIDTLTVASPPVILRAQPEESSPSVILRAQPEESSPSVILRAQPEESSLSVILRAQPEESSLSKKGSFALRAQDDAGPARAQDDAGPARAQDDAGPARAQDDEMPSVILTLSHAKGKDPLPVTLPVPFGVRILVASRFSGKNPLTKAPTNSPTKSTTTPHRANVTDEVPVVASSGSHHGRVAAAIGTMVHSGLEHAIRGIAFHPQETWLRICDANLIDDRDATVQEALNSALDQLRDVLESKTWNDLIDRFPRRRAEVPVLFLDARRNLHSGTIDLLLDNGNANSDSTQAPSEVLIVDFKTSHVEDDLRDHAREHGYFDQVASYAETLRTTWPDAKIAGCIFYTRPPQTVDVPL